MSGFEINFYSASKDFHRYSTDDFALLEIGVGNFNVSSLAKFLNLRFLNGTFQSNARPVNPDIKEFFNSNPVELANKLSGVDSVDDMEILAFDEEDKVYKLKRRFSEIVRLNPNRYKTTEFQEPPKKLDQFLDGWNKVQLGAETDEKLIKGYKVVVNRIQNSLSGCILYDLNLNILGTTRKSQMRLSFLNTRDNESSKTISFNGSPFISAVGQDAIGMKYGRKNTDNNGLAGVYSTPSKGAGNPEDMVGAQMRLAYDPATKTWESGTQQVLARLVDDIDGVNIPELSPQEMLSISSEATYDVPPEENPWMGKANSGRAIPLSTEDGNPNLYGPNFKGGCANTSNKAMVRAVNRSNKSFKSGRLVVLSFINGEWLIVGGEGDEIDGSNIRFGNFEYQQSITPAKHFFAIPGSSERLTPDIIKRKYRNWFYFWSYKHSTDPFRDLDSTGQGFDLYERRGITDLKSAREEWITSRKLTILASSAPKNVDIIQYLINMLDSPEESNIISIAREDGRWMSTDLKTVTVEEYFAAHDGFEAATIRRQEESEKLTYEETYGVDSDFLYRYFLPFLEQDYPVPKNVLNKIAEKLALNFPRKDNAPERLPSGPIDRSDVPYFWGALFPDGYKSSQALPFMSKVNSPIYDSDFNLKEFSMVAAASSPYFRNTSDLDKFYQRYGSNYPDPSLMRKTGVYFKVTRTPESRERENYIDRAIKTPNAVFGLEPLQPKRIQFSPMSIEFLHAPTQFIIPPLGSAEDFFIVRTDQDFFKSAIINVGDKNFSLLDYAKFLWGPAGNPTKRWSETYFINAPPAYILRLLNYGLAFTSDTIVRHSAPLGVPNGNNLLPKFPIGSLFQRSPVMPIIAIKSTITTSAKALKFTTTQRFGYVQQTSIIPGSGPVVIALPFGGGLFWNEPATPIGTRSEPQWGDRSLREDIDSFGTTALHVKVYEHWPLSSTEYLGELFTVLHYNDKQPRLNQDYDYERKEWGFPLNDEGLLVLSMSPLDFKEPTLKIETGGGDIMNVGVVVTEANLANFSDWKYNLVRRGQLLSGGGFAYIRRAIFVSSAYLDPQALQAKGGSGYKKGDKFVYPDGYTIEVIKVEDIDLPGGGVLKDSITEIDTKSNLGTNKIVKNINSYQADITSVRNVNPTYMGSGGLGAIFKADFTIGRLVGYDPEPKEVCPSTRITKSSNGGQGRVEGQLQTTVDISDTNKRQFDIFYYFHNDPATYSLGATSFTDSDAHYVISQVDPA